MVINGDNISTLYSSLRSISARTGLYRVEQVANSFVGQVLSFLEESCPFVAEATATSNPDLCTSTVLIRVTNVLHTRNRFARVNSVQIPFDLSASSLSLPRDRQQQSHFSDLQNQLTRPLLIESSTPTSPTSTSLSINSTFKPQGFQQRQPQGYLNRELQSSNRFTSSLASRITRSVDRYRPSPYQDSRRQRQRQRSPSRQRQRSPAPRSPTPTPNPLFQLLEEDEEDDRPSTPSWKRL